jgi:hypothetical protein
VPLEYVYYELMIEWGLTFETFQKQPYEVVHKIIEYKQANFEGQKIAIKKK